LEDIVGVILCEMEGIDKDWSSINIEVVVNALGNELTFFPMYSSKYDKGEQALILKGRSRSIVESTLLYFYNLDMASDKNKWNKLHFRIKNNSFRPRFEVDKKYDDDLDWPYENKIHRN